ncbi:hypothetical protein SAMN05444166_2085 [Singulisphaera sp. GP187]|uniref:hypothetical protein n=1 Tax=Singulisphaera sp. GP187 TaxID=1882752 RepID=UPI00092B617C|nr:hypothetical protein [Singulisphaera sp. GP187]SIO02449.1 hypothetical protein SAMN05444166_2085 [Singulisphaera sp. GP187]
MKFQNTFVCLFVAALTTAAGCGANNGLHLAKVHGKVTYKGQPITYGTIMFEPDTSRGTNGPAAVGSITSDGSFTMSTEESGDGAIVGLHRVAVVGLEPMPDSPQKAMPDPVTSPREFMIAKTQAGTRTNFTKKAEVPTFTDKDGKVFRITIPEKLGNPSTSNIKASVGRGSNTVNITIKEDGTAEISH